MRGRPIIAVFLLTLSVGLLGPASPVAAQDDTADQAVWLLQKATLVHRNGFHNVLLRALRQMRDPRLESLFGELVQRRHPELKIHGILGLGEIHDPPQLDLTLVADIKDPAMQARLISAAIDSDLLAVAQAKELATWPGLDPAVRVLVLGKLVAEGEPIDTAMLETSAASDNLALGGMVKLLQLQMSGGDAVAAFQSLDQSSDENRDRVRALLLQTAMKHDFDKVAPWAAKIVATAPVDNALTYQALRAALMFNAPAAVNTWMHRYDTAERLVDRLRLAMLALDIAEHLDARLFEPMTRGDDEVIRLIGEVGASLAGGRPDVEAIGRLIDQNNLMASRWALGWAMERSEADPQTALPVLWKLIEAGRSEEPRFRAERLESVVIATQAVHENIAGAHQQLMARLAEEPMFVQEAMLMGLVRSRADEPAKIVAGTSKFKSRTADALALLITAKNLKQLTQEQERDLSLIVRGGAGLQEPLRIQAAWTYLTLTEQDRVALATIFGAR